MKGTLVGVMILISPENNYLLSPPTLQVGIYFLDPPGSLGHESARTKVEADL